MKLSDWNPSWVHFALLLVMAVYSHSVPPAGRVKMGTW